jgi:hypothetical protein
VLTPNGSSSNAPAIIVVGSGRFSRVGTVAAVCNLCGQERGSVSRSAHARMQAWQVCSSALAWAKPLRLVLRTQPRSVRIRDRQLESHPNRSDLRVLVVDLVLLRVFPSSRFSSAKRIRQVLKTGLMC